MTIRIAAFPCRACFCRLRRPFFRLCKDSVEGGFLPIQRTMPIERVEQGAPGLQPHALVFPLLQAVPVGGGRGRLLGKV